jgi:hypothetical protein
VCLLLLSSAMLPNKGQPGTYGFVEQLVDGLRIDINQISTMVSTVGRYKTPEKGEWYESSYGLLPLYCLLTLGATFVLIHTYLF